MSVTQECAAKGAGLQRVQLPPQNWFALHGSVRCDGDFVQIAATPITGLLGEIARSQRLA